MIVSFDDVQYALSSAVVFFSAHKGIVEVAKSAVEAYKIGKDIKEHFEIKEGEPKLVDREWLEKSGFGAHMDAQGYTLRWTNPDRIETRVLDGYDLLYEIDNDKNVKRRLVRRDGSTLMGKRA
jgi:hypothetical protein